MAILAVDTSADETSCCVRGNNISIVKIQKIKQSHAESLFALINEACLESSVKINDISHFVIITGPGSYTGVRIGLSALKGVAYASGKPLIGVSKFEILANNFAENDNEFFVCFDAKRNEIYYQKFIKNNGVLKKLSEPLLVKLSDINSLKGKKIIFSDEKNTFLGDKIAANDDYIGCVQLNAGDAAEYCDLLIAKNHIDGLIAAPLYIRNHDYVKTSKPVYNNVQ